MDGTAATRYAVVVDVAKVSPDYPGPADLAGSHTASLPVDLWIDGQGLPVKR